MLLPKCKYCGLATEQERSLQLEVISPARAPLKHVSGTGESGNARLKASDWADNKHTVGTARPAIRIGSALLERTRISVTRRNYSIIWFGRYERESSRVSAGMAELTVKTYCISETNPRLRLLLGFWA